MPDPTPPKKDFSPFQAVEIVWEVGIAIAVPAVAFALGGRWLDKRFETSPLFLGLGLFLAFCLSTVIVLKKGRDIAKRL